MCEVVKVKIDFHFIAACAWTGATDWSWNWDWIRG